MARSLSVSLTGTQATVTITGGGKWVRVESLVTVAGGKISVRGNDVAAVLLANDCVTMAAIAGNSVVMRLPSDGLLSAIATSACLTSFTTVDRPL